MVLLQTGVVDLTWESINILGIKFIMQFSWIPQWQLNISSINVWRNHQGVEIYLVFLALHPSPNIYKLHRCTHFNGVSFEIHNPLGSCVYKGVEILFLSLLQLNHNTSGSIPRRRWLMKACEGQCTSLYVVVDYGPDGCDSKILGCVQTQQHRDLSAWHLCYSRVLFCNSFSWLIA